jgi:DNA-binding NtrC family response regulator
MMLEKGRILSVEHFCQESRAECIKSGGCDCGCSPPISNQIIQPAEGINIEEVEKEFIRQALARYDGNQTKAAQCLGLSLDTLRYRRKKFGLENYQRQKEKETTSISTPKGEKEVFDSTKIAPAS